ncbi:putative pectinesterase/pectinesterase inhibitor 34 [Hibiscus syriacus]|uniref:Pectinesterase n=1 Tax=Hibiscus syriacus TaxID=106335 RepID=A0A6A2XXM8_HIBSY|nr:putative pectinesterase/pectinesterase inhibitor 34 [Hibiscus syriacus]
MGYDRLPPFQHSELTPKNNSKRLLFISVVAFFTIIIVSAVCAGLVVRLRDGGGAATPIPRKPTQAISRTCGKTRFRKLCVNSLLQFPGSLTAGEQDLVHMSFNVTLQRFNKALYTTTSISYIQMDPRVRSAYDDCLELLEDSVDALSHSLSSVVSNGKVGSTQDVMTWLSAALTNQDTCTEGFDGLSGAVKDQVAAKLADLSELVSNCLSIFAAISGDDLGGVPTQNRRLLASGENIDEQHFPKWLRREERALLDTPVSAIRPDLVVSKRRKRHPATGSGFIARDITFENWAGPAKHQAVALRIGADHAVVYRCNIIGYQDTLYVHSNRQFYRECDIYGTVDFIFGNAAVVFQNCSIYARKPMLFQKNTITAQNRKDPNQNTGISIHACRILPTPDLAAANGSFQTYLGRPWKLYSRAVFMLSYMSDHIHPRGWLEWNATSPVDTLYYGEYKNYGPGGAIGQRVRWPGYRLITSDIEAAKFTVAQFIYGSSWLPSTGVTFLAGLEV